MAFKAWELMVMEEMGVGTTSRALVNKVANYLAENGSDSIGNSEFISACRACGADPYSFTGEDMEQLQRKLNRFT